MAAAASPCGNAQTSIALSLTYDAEKLFWIYQKDLHRFVMQWPGLDAGYVHHDGVGAADVDQNLYSDGLGGRTGW